MEVKFALKLCDFVGLALLHVHILCLGPWFFLENRHKAKEEEDKKSCGNCAVWCHSAALQTLLL
jgi:hypothetical protein